MQNLGEIHVIIYMIQMVYKEQKEMRWSMENEIIL